MHHKPVWREWLLVGDGAALGDLSKHRRCAQYLHSPQVFGKRGVPEVAEVISQAMHGLLHACQVSWSFSGVVQP